MTDDHGPEFTDLSALMADALAGVHEPAPSVPTGYAGLDKLLCGGLYPGELIVLAGQSGVGTSTVALDILRACAIGHGLPACLVTTQETAADTSRRIAAAEARVPAHRLRSGTLDDTEKARLAARLPVIAAAPLHVAGNAQGSLAGFTAGIAGIPGLRLAVIDRASRGAAGLKRAAMRHGITVIAVCVLERPESAVDPVSLRHLDAEFVETADAVILLEDLGAWAEGPGKVRLVVAKHRRGPCGDVDLIRDGRHARFLEIPGDA
jgi:replicative DNA helicase